MRRSLFLVALVALVVALAIPAVAQEPASATCCTNAVTGQSVPKLVKDCAQLGLGWAESAGPCTPGTTEPGWWDTLLEWADGKVIYEPDAATLAKLLAWLATLMAAVQALKKLVEGSGSWAWLLKLIPGWSKIADVIAHGWGPVILNGILTGGVMLTAALQSPGLTLGEVARILVAILGTDVLYRLARLVFPKGAPAK